MADENNPEATEVDPEDIPGIVGYIKSKFVESETGRFTDERRWLQAYKNYKGTDDTPYRSSEKSKVLNR